METIILVGESQIKLWMRDMIKEVLSEQAVIRPSTEKDDEPFISRKDAALRLGISTVTLNAWIKKGLPAHKQEARVYLLYSEIRNFMLNKRINV